MSRLDKFSHRPQTRLIALENTHNASGGTVLPLSYTQEICAEMHERGVSVHLDGARIFNAAAALGEPMRSLTESFDSVALIVVWLGGFYRESFASHARLIAGGSPLIPITKG